MICLQSTLLVLLLALLCPVQSKKVRSVEDVVCASPECRNVYKSVTNGIQEVLKHSDPLRLNEVRGQLPSLNYELNNATLAEMRSCEVRHIKLDEEKFTFQFDMLCPQLVLNHHYDCKGILDTVEIDGKGFVRIVLNDYEIDIEGTFGQFISDGYKTHFFIDNYYLEFKPKGEVVIDIEGSLHNEISKSNLAKAYVKENAREMEKLLRSPTMESYMAIFVDKIDTYLKTFTIDETQY